MAIHTCNLSTADKRAQVRDLLERYEDEDTTIAEMQKLDADVLSLHHEVLIEGTAYMLTPMELMDVYSRRRDRIAEQLSKLGISLTAIDEQPSQSPKLDAAIRGMGVTDSVTLPLPDRINDPLENTL